MRKYQKFKTLAVLAIVLLGALVLGGCGDSAPKVKADETLNIMAKGVLTLEFVDFDKIGIKKEKQEEWENKIRSKMKERVMQMSKKSAVKMTDEQVQKLTDITLDLQKKATVSTKLISEEKNSAVVELSVSALDMKKFTAEMQNKMQQKIQGMSQEEVKAKIVDIVLNLYTESMENPVFKAEPEVMQIKCRLDEKENVWRPEGQASNFIVKVINTVHGS